MSDESLGRNYLEALRWPGAPVCPHCAATGEATRLTPKTNSPRHARPGAYQCKACRQQFTVTVGTILENSRIPLHKWLFAIHLLCASETGINAHELHQHLDITYKTAWRMVQRLRYALHHGPVFSRTLQQGRKVNLSGWEFEDAVSDLLKVKPPVKQSGSDGVEDLVAQLREKLSLNNR